MNQAKQGEKERIKDTRLRYKGICPVCGAELWICKSIMMIDFGQNMGHGSCYQCNTFLHLTFNEDQQAFDTETWDDYMKRERKEKNEVW